MLLQWKCCFILTGSPRYVDWQGGTLCLQTAGYPVTAPQLLCLQSQLVSAQSVTMISMLSIWQIEGYNLPSNVKYWLLKQLHPTTSLVIGHDSTLHHHNYDPPMAFEDSQFTIFIHIHDQAVHYHTNSSKATGKAHKLSSEEHKGYKPASRFLEPSACTGNPVTWAMWNLIGSNLPPAVILQCCHTYINKQETWEMHQYPKIAVFWDVTSCGR